MTFGVEHGDGGLRAPQRPARQARVKLARVRGGEGLRVGGLRRMRLDPRFECDGLAFGLDARDGR